MPPLNMLDRGASDRMSGGYLNCHVASRAFEGREGGGKSALLLLPEQWRLQRGAQVPARRRKPVMLYRKTSISACAGEEYRTGLANLEFAVLSLAASAHMLIAMVDLLSKTSAGGSGSAGQYGRSFSRRVELGCNASSQETTCRYV